MYTCFYYCGTTSSRSQTLVTNTLEPWGELSSEAYVNVKGELIRQYVL